MLLTDINLESSWNTLWGNIQQSVGSLLTILGYVGMLLVVGSVLKWLWDRRRGQGGQGFQAHSHVVYTLVLGAVLAAPDVMIPWMLGALDAVANGISSVGKGL